MKRNDPRCGMKDVPGVSKTHFMTYEGNGRVVLLLDTSSTNPINDINYGDDDNNDISMTLSERQLVDDCKISEWVLVKYEYDGKMYHLHH